MMGRILGRSRWGVGAGRSQADKVWDWEGGAHGPAEVREAVEFGLTPQCKKQVPIATGKPAARRSQSERPRR